MSRIAQKKRSLRSLFDMRLGPVFAHEMIATSRRKRYFFLRFIYGLAILSLIAINYKTFTHEFENAFASLTGDWRMYGPRPFSLSQRKLELAQQIIGRFVNRTVVAFLNLQDAMIVLLTPAIVAGSIAIEKQRKTLHYLLTSQLTDGEIVLGKLAARLSHVAVFIAVGLPIVSLLLLLGGVDPIYVLFSYLNSCSTAFFLASLCLFVSCLARRAREATFLAYSAQTIWLLVPLINGEIPAVTYSAAFRWVPWANDQVLLANPLAFHLREFRSSAPAGSADTEFVSLSIILSVLQFFMGIGLVQLSVVGLRPIFARQGGGGRPTVWTASRSIRRFARPACGDDAILWKERYASPPSRLGRLLGVSLTVVAGVLLGYLLLEYARLAFWEMLEYGFDPSTIGDGPSSGLDISAQGEGFAAREELIVAIRSCTVAFYAFWAISVVGSAAGSVTSEIEEDTWVSLVSTPLSGRGIVLAKMLGALWRNRAPAVLMVVFWTVGFCLGALHPFGFFAGLIELVVFGWFLAALGTFVSLGAGNTMRALVWSFIVLFLVSGGYLLVLLPLGLPDQSPSVAVAAIPFLWNWSLLSFENVSGTPASRWIDTNYMKNSASLHIFDSNLSWFRSARRWEVVSACATGVLFFAVAAYGLTIGALSRFEKLVDRPSRVRSDATRGGSKGPARSVAGD